MLAADVLQLHRERVAGAGEEIALDEQGVANRRFSQRITTGASASSMSMVTAGTTITC